MGDLLQRKNVLPAPATFGAARIVAALAWGFLKKNLLT